MPDSSSVADTSTIADRLHNNTIQTVWKLIYWILGLFFLGFGCLALIDGSQWWGVIFIINGILFLNSSSSLNEKGRETIYREIVYLFLALFFCFLGILIAVPTEQTTKQWWGIFCFIIMTEFSILSISLKTVSKANPIENLFKKISSLSFVDAIIHLSSSVQIKPEIKRLEIAEGNKKLSLFEILVGIVSIITGIIAIYSFFKGE
jgi:hypothetical protein